MDAALLIVFACLLVWQVLSLVFLLRLCYAVRLRNAEIVRLKASCESLRSSCNVLSEQVEQKNSKIAFQVNQNVRLRGQLAEAQEELAKKCEAMRSMR